MPKSLRRALLSATTLIALSFLSYYTTAAAEETAKDISEEIIVTGSKFTRDFGGKSGIPLEKVPQSVQVITAQRIIDIGAQSIGDLLRHVPSANPGYSRVGAFQSFSLKVRGFIADQMRNGLRQRFYEDVDASALSNIERVEVLKGPSGALYGQSAVGGIISIITKRPEEETSIKFAGTLGNYDQKVASFDMTGTLAPGLTARVNGEVEQSGTFVDFQDIDRLNGALSLRYEASETVTANLVAEYVDRKTQRYPGLPIPGTVADNGGHNLRRGLYLGEPAVDDLTADAPLVQLWMDVNISDLWTLIPRLQYQEFNTAFTQIRLRLPQDDQLTINRNGRIGEENDEYYIGQLDLTGEISTGPIVHKLLIGYEYNRERGRFTQFNLTNVAPINVLNPTFAFSTVPLTSVFAFDSLFNIDGHAVYFQDQVALSERLGVVGTLRHSWIKATNADVDSPFFDSSKVQSTIWSLGATYRLSAALSLYGGYNTGFDIESSAGARAANGEPLKPEESSQLEIGVRYKAENFRGSLAVFEVKRTNALTTDPNNPDFSLNVGTQRVQGFEVEGEWHPLQWWSLTIGYAYLDSKITKSNDGDQGLRLGDVPAHSIRLQTDIAVPGTELTLNGGVGYVSNRLLVNGSDVRLPGYAIANLGASYRFDPVTLTLTANNLLNKIYYTASGNNFAVIPGDPRTVSLRAGVEF